MLKIKDLRIFEKIIRNYINFFINYKVTIMKKIQPDITQNNEASESILGGFYKKVM